MQSSCCRIFIGQASGKANGVGMKQAEQKKVLTDFRSGAFNTLVATCIGEEGLDIPQVQPHTALESLHNPSHQYKAWKCYSKTPCGLVLSSDSITAEKV